MTSRPHTPLDSDEQALAKRLAADPVAAPSPALDAAVLEAARAAVEAGHTPPRAHGPALQPVATPRRRHRRWPVGVGVAATLLVAVGVAWQLRPDPATHSGAWSEVPPPDVTSTPEAAPAADARPPIANHRARAVPPPAVQPDVPAPAARATAPAPDERRAEASGTPDAASAAAPVPEPQAPAPAAATASASARMTASGSGPAAAPAASAEPADASAGSTAERAPTPAAREAMIRRAAPVADVLHDLPDDDEPPATADSPQVRAAWLERVRELLDAGDIVAARASLAEFHRRHPDADLPPDLRALLD